MLLQWGWHRSWWDRSFCLRREQKMDTWQKGESGSLYFFIFRLEYGRGRTHGQKADENTRVKLVCLGLKRMDNTHNIVSLFTKVESPRGQQKKNTGETLGDCRKSARSFFFFGEIRLSKRLPNLVFFEIKSGGRQIWRWWLAKSIWRPFFLRQICFFLTNTA